MGRRVARCAAAEQAAEAKGIAQPQIGFWRFPVEAETGMEIDLLGAREARTSPHGLAGIGRVRTAGIDVAGRYGTGLRPRRGAVWGCRAAHKQRGEYLARPENNEIPCLASKLAAGIGCGPSRSVAGGRARLAML